MTDDPISPALVDFAADVLRKACTPPFMPTRVHLLSQVIPVELAENLHVPSSHWVHEEEMPEEESHAHKAYGVYSEGEQTITLDQDLGFERVRDTFVHENLHAILSIANVGAFIEAEEQVVRSLAPIVLAWLRDNPQAVAWLQETQR